MDYLELYRSKLREKAEELSPSFYEAIKNGSKIWESTVINSDYYSVFCMDDIIKEEEIKNNKLNFIRTTRQVKPEDHGLYYSRFGCYIITIKILNDEEFKEEIIKSILGVDGSRRSLQFPKSKYYLFRQTIINLKDQLPQDTKLRYGRAEGKFYRAIGVKIC
jgi:hypothetical protein